jgi:hypothetical protein
MTAIYVKEKDDYPPDKDNRLNKATIKDFPTESNKNLSRDFSESP